VIEKAVDVILGVADDHTERQFVFHICAGIETAFVVLARQNKTASPFRDWRRMTTTQKN
jgi:hypothetical protein